jgi:hypothetical protein
MTANQSILDEEENWRYVKEELPNSDLEHE